MARQASDLGTPAFNLAGIRVIDDYASPPPKNPFWKNARYSIPITTEGIVTVGLEREPRGRTFMHTSPIDTRKKYEEVMVRQLAKDSF